MKLHEEVENIYGKNAFSHALFYSHNQSLRFELSNDGSLIKKFITAYRKAEEIINSTIEKEDRILVCISFYCGHNYLSNLSIFKGLKKCEINIPKTHEEWHRFDDDHGLFRRFLLFEIKHEALFEFFWAAFSTNLNIKPSANCNIYLINYSKGILFNPYDERGMDVIGPNKLLLSRLYKEFKHYLLDYDRKKMSLLFDEK